MIVPLQNKLILWKKMKRLVLVRHAKSVHWGYEDDFNRELTERGKSDASRVSNHMGKLGIIPDRIISSPASRAWQTAEIFAGQLHFPPEDLLKNHELYHGLTTGELMDLIHAFPEEVTCVFLFGHNPTFEYYARGLCKSFDGDMPTSSAAVIDFHVNRWKEVTSRSGLLFGHFNPKEIPV
jgi:phosphohistidine phosphatase